VKYVPVRRPLALLEHSLDGGTQWAVSEPDGESLARGCSSVSHWTDQGNGWPAFERAGRRAASSQESGGLSHLLSTGAAMVQIAVRAFSTVFAVVVAVSVSARWGDTGTGKILAAIVIAVTIAVIEGFMLWSPRHLAWARRLMDARAIWTGIWVQDVKVAFGERRERNPQRNAFAVFYVDYDDGYSIVGRAYDLEGKESARWHSKGDPMFTKNGRSVSYVWDGVAMDATVDTDDPNRAGLATMTLDEDNAGSGWIEHVALNRRLDFDLQRVTRPWLAQRKLAEFDPRRLVDPDTRREFAAAFARRRAEAGG
jgi:hypothetical protein